jgi:exosome complex exonuclease DIS3/RRP44
MLTQRSTVHKTKRGRILRHITEHYLRDDIYCGLNCSKCKQHAPFEFPQMLKAASYPPNTNLFSIIKQGSEEVLRGDFDGSLKGIDKSKFSSLKSSNSSHLETFLAKFVALLGQYDNTEPDCTKNINHNHMNDGSNGSDDEMKDYDDDDENDDEKNGKNNQKCASLVLVPDSSVFLQQFDFLETQTVPFSNIIVLQSVLNYLQRKHYKIYQKLRSLCTTATFQSSGLLKSNFESKSFSIANTSQDQSVTPHLYVFSDLHHKQVYTTAVSQVGDITDDLLIPFKIVRRNGDKNTKRDDFDHKNFIYPPHDSDSEEIDFDDDIPTSFVQFVDVPVEVTPNDPQSTQTPISPPLDSEQSFEQRYLSELFLSTIKWYHRHQTANTCVIGLTADLDSALKQIELGIPAIPIDFYIYLLLPYHPGYESLYAQCVEEQQTRDRSKWVYSEHYTTQQIESGVQSGALYSGKLNIDRDYWSQGSISTEEHGRVLIPGFQYMNRALDGDIVAVKLWPRELWHELATGLAPDELPAEKQQTLSTASTLADGILDGSEHRFVTANEDYIPVDDDKNDDKNNEKSKQLEESLKQRQYVPTGEIVGIVQQGNRTFCGSIEHTDKNEGNVLLMPHNRRIPKIFIHSRQLQNLVSSRLLVRVDSWPITSRHPHGHITRILGNIGDNEAETEMVLIEHDVKHDKWSIEVEKCLPAPDYVIDDQERAGRVDLRGIDICSIDPPGCTDIDDALHCIKLPNGNYEAGVHIADVTHYMKPGSALDIEAAKRSTSVYLVDRRIDMIPARLSTNLCSLHEHVERLAFSTVWELTPDADIVSVKFFKSVIHSKGAMTYAQAQERIDLEPEHCDTDELKALYADRLTQPCKDLMMLARKIKQKRFDKGALSLASTEVKFKLNSERTRADDMLIYQLKEANSLVEEFMLLANVSVAEHTLRYFPLLALLRGHPTPPEEMLLPLVKAAKSWGHEVDISNGKTISASLDGINDPSNPMFNKVLRVLTTRCMTQAKYMSSGEIASIKQLHHFGLAASTYTHFTSPIRRYADCIVHRLLATSLGIHPLPEAIKDKAHMRDVVENLNLRHRSAQMASRASTDLWILKYFTGKDVIADALVLAVKSTGIKVIVQKYGIECAVRLVPPEFTKTVNTVHFDTVEDNNALTPPEGLFYNPELMTLTLHGARFQTLQSVQVRLCVKENKARRRWLHVELAGSSQDVITTNLLQGLQRELLQDSIDVTQELLNEREKELEMIEKGQIGQAGVNVESAEVYIDVKTIKDDEMFKPAPVDDEMGLVATVQERKSNQMGKNNKNNMDDLQRVSKKPKRNNVSK